MVISICGSESNVTWVFNNKNDYSLLIRLEVKRSLLYTHCMKVLSHQLKPLFVEACHSAFPEIAEGDLLELVTIGEPRDKAHGDFSTPVAFQLSKKLGKNPKDVGEAIVENFPKDYRIGSVEFVSPGFVNLRLDQKFLEEELKLLEKGFSLEDSVDHKRPIIVEYPSTNAAKPMGVHHILTTIIGDSLANLYDYMGYEVLRINHLGDWGTNFGKIIYAVETWGDEQVIHADPNKELSRLYVKFNEEAEKNPELEDEARKIFASLEKGDELRTTVWEWIVHESTEDLKRLLTRMGVEIDYTMGESFYRNMTDDVINLGIEKKLFFEGERGALIFDMGEDQVPAMVRKGDGATLYLTRDLATIKYRVDTWHPEAIFYIVDHAQSLHFRQNFTVAAALGYKEDTHLEHISFGRMSFKGSGMSSRKGNVVKLEDLLDEAAKRAGEMAAEKGTELTREEYARLAEILGTGSVKYAILSQDRNKDIHFDWEKIITLEGNSAPYLLYTAARAYSILRKVGALPLNGLPVLTDDSEIALIRQMIKFPEVLERTVQERKVHLICTYLYELSSLFNRFYGTVHVSNAETVEQQRTRVGLIHAFLHQMKAGLSILGIPLVERM
ncbi:MAG: arginyl-tRNA synthetase [Oceanicoccus sp.]|jgi:arginyl-tRNA synthetase